MKVISKYRTILIILTMLGEIYIIPSILNLLKPVTYLRNENLAITYLLTLSLINGSWAYLWTNNKTPMIGRIFYILFAIFILTPVVYFFSLWGIKY